MPPPLKRLVQSPPAKKVCRSVRLGIVHELICRYNGSVKGSPRCWSVAESSLRVRAERTGKTAGMGLAVLSWPPGALALALEHL